MRLMSVTLVVLIALVLVPARASAEPKPYMIHGGVGFVKALNDNAPDGSIGLHGGLIYRLQNSPQVGIGAEFGYYMLGSESYSESDFYGNYVEVEADWATYPILGEIYFFVTPRTSTPYLVGGLGLYPLKVSVDAAASYNGYGGSASGSETETNMGINGGLGFLFGRPGAQLRFGADGRFHIIMTEGDSTQLIALMGRIFF